MPCWTRILLVVVAFSLPAVGASNAVHAQEVEVDLLDAWINVFTIPEFDIYSVTKAQGTTGTGLNYLQIIKGREGVNFQVQWSRLGFGALSFSKKSVVRNFGGVTPSKYQKIKFRGGKGALIDHQGCRSALVGIRGVTLADDVAGDVYEAIIHATACGTENMARLSSYLRQIKLATPATNGTDMALQRTAVAAPPQTRPAKSALQIACEQVGNEDDRKRMASSTANRMADFMGTLSRSQLSRFLQSSQDCQVFQAGGR